jgi:predicted amidophosphoribosyltransferase
MIVVFNPTAGRRRATELWRVLDVLSENGVRVRVAPVLVGVRRRRDQVGLGRAARSDNLRGSIAPTTAASGLRGVVLVDDVVTSGATLAECARALRTVGIEPLAACVVAATRARH